MVLVVLALLVMVGAVIALLPLWLPWRARLRFVLNATTMQSWTGPPAMAHGMELREVTVTAVDGAPGWFAVRVRARHPGACSLELVGTGPLACVSQLRRWSAAETPLLLVTDADGDVSLHGPANDIAGLCILEETDNRDDSVGAST